MLASKLLSAAGGTETLYVDDVFSTYLYTGNGSTQTINNGIDLAGKGGMVWLKGRSTSGTYHALQDSSRNNFNNTLSSNVTNADLVDFNLIDPLQNGFFLNSGTGYNDTGGLYGPNYVSWTFRKAAKFFDCGTYTGNGVAGRQIPHSLGVAPGMVIVKCTSTTGDWRVTVRKEAYNGTNEGVGFLNATSSFTTASDASGNHPYGLTSAANFSVAGLANTNGATYVWYAFAHDTSAEGIVQCGSVTSTAGGAIPTVNLGWEPQYILYKNSGAAWNWEIWDSQRSWAIASTGNATANALKPNLSDAETSASTAFTPTATGFYSNANFGASQTFIYLAIRRPNKPPTTGTQVYNAIARTGTGAAATVTGVGFAPDMALIARRSSYSVPQLCPKLTGPSRSLISSSTNAEQVLTTSLTAFGQDGVSFGTDAGVDQFNASGATYINHFFKRAPGVFDVVCYTGTGSTLSVNHSLGVAPEMIIVKCRNSTGNWYVGALFGSSNYWDILLSTNNGNLNSYPNEFNSKPSSTAFSVFQMGNIAASGATYIAYLFATKAGISKVGSYTGNGSSQTINCGFTTGARFILIKRTDSTGDWYVWDSVRGIVAGNDPHLSLNSTAAEVTTNDSIDPDNTGFIVNQLAATNINVTSATYIYLALA